MPITDDRLIKDFEKARSDRHNWESLWQTASDLVRPSRHFTNKREKGGRRRRQIYDDTASEASTRFAHALHGFLTNPAQKWFNLEPMNGALMEREPVQIWLQEVRDRMLHIFSMPVFGFNTEIASVYTDLTDFGTAAMTLMSHTSGMLRFRARRLSDTYIRGDSDGDIVRVYRTYTLANWEAILKFGESSVSEKARDEKKDDEEREYVQCIFWRDSFDPTRADGRNKPIASVHIDIDAEKRVKESGFDQWPYIVARMYKEPEEVWGRSPTMDALSRIGTINVMVRDQIIATQRSFDPPLIVPANSMEGPIRTAPGSAMWVRQGVNPNNAIGTLPVPNVAISEGLIEKRQEAIRTAYFQDIVGPLPENDRMTATEILARVQQRMPILSPMLARIQQELHSPLIKQTFAMMNERNMLPPVPDELAGQPLSIDYVGPLALAQKASDVGNFQQLMEIVTILANVDPSAVDNIDSDESVRGSAARLNAPFRFLRSPRERDRLRQQRAEAQAAAQRAETAKTMAEAAESGAKASQLIGGGANAA